MDLINPADSLERQNEKLIRITQALMRRAEQAPDQTGLAYAQFERAALLEEQVRQRTADLERTLDLLHESNARIASANQSAEDARATLATAIETIEEGFALFGNDGSLEMFNSRFCLALPDVRAELSVGTSFETYVGLISDSSFLDWPGEETPEQWRKTRLSLHRQDHVVFNTRLTENRWLQVSEHRTSTGGTVILQTDVSEIMRLQRQEREELIHHQAQMLQATLDHLNQGICVFGPDTRFVGWNKRMEEFLLRPLDNTFRGAPVASLIERLDGLFRFTGQLQKRDLLSWAGQSSGRPSLSFEAQRRDDAIFDVFAQEMPDQGFVISFTDVTQERKTSYALRDLNETLERRVEDRTVELNKALEEARLANATKNRFVAAASHDLLQPMSAAKLYASALEDKLAGTDNKDLARRTIMALENAEGIIDALMDISKLDLGLAVFDVGAVDLNQTLSALATEFAPIAADRGVDLRIKPCSAFVESDESYLHRILQNFISNALRYTSGRKVLVGARRASGAIRVEIRDQGPGISYADQKVIFQEFRQLTKGGSAGQGLGLGLAIVERACKMLGHKVDLWSEPGVGSCFSVTLEISSSQNQRKCSNGADRPAKRPLPLLMGLVENDESLAEGISLIVESFGSDVVHATSGEDALDLIEDLGIVPDGFLLDYQLGAGMSGVDLARKLRARYGERPIEIISANRSQTLHDQCEALALPLHRKPLTRDVIQSFLSRVSAAVDSSKRP